MELAQGERSTAEHEGRKSCTGGESFEWAIWIVFHRERMGWRSCIPRSVTNQAPVLHFWPKMAYASVDQLQKVLAKKVFHYAKDSKKTAGRALGTLVEIITFYLLKSWGFEHSMAIERALAEYGNPEITHNVEYSLHAIIRQQRIVVPFKLPINAT